MSKRHPRQRVNGHSQHEGANAQATVRNGVVTVVGTESGTVVKLKPCPFCGDEESLYPSYEWPGTGKPYAIDCVRCGFDFTPRKGMDVIEMWNRRVSA